MGGAYSAGPTGGSGGGGQLPPGAGGGMGRFNDGRGGVPGGNAGVGGHSMSDQASNQWLNLVRSGQIPSAGGGGGATGLPPMRTQSQLPTQQQQQVQQLQQSNAQAGIEELISNPNYLCSFLDNLRAQQQLQHYQQQQQAASQSQMMSNQASVSHSRSPIHHQQSPQTGIPRPSSGSIGGLPGQSASGRPGSATSVQYNQGRISSGASGLKYTGSAAAQQQHQQKQQGMAEHISAATAAAAYSHRPPSSASGSLRNSSGASSAVAAGGGGGYGAHIQAYAAAVAAANQLSHGDNLQDLTRGGANSASGGIAAPPSKRPRRISTGSAVPPSGTATPSSSPCLVSQSSGLSRQQQQQQQQQELLARQLQNVPPNNRTAIIALFTSVAQQQQQQQQQHQQPVTAAAAISAAGRAQPPPPPPPPQAGFYQTSGSSDSYGQRSGAPRQPGLLVSSPNTLSQTSVSTATGGQASSYGNYASTLAAVTAAAAAAQQQQQQQAVAAAAAAVAAANAFHQQQAAVAAAAAVGRSGYLQHPSGSVPRSSASGGGGVSGSSSSSAGYRGQLQQGGAGSYHGHGAGHGMPVSGATSGLASVGTGGGLPRQQTKEPAYHPQVEAISPAPEEARMLDAVEVKFQRDREDMQRRLHEIDSRLSKEENQLRFLLDRESTLAADLQKNETSASAVVATLPPQQRDRLLSELDDEKPYVNPIQALLAETHARAKRQHKKMARFCGRRVNADPNALPIYRQPCDVPALLHVRAVYKDGFRRHLIEYIHRRKRASKARLELLSNQYTKVAQAFYKRHEKTMNSAKRKQKDARNREIFEKVFPELKKEKEGGKGDDAHDASSNAGSNGADGDQVYDLSEDIAKMKEYAIDPPVMLAPWEKSYHFLCTAHRITDPAADLARALSLEKWTEEDKTRFKERFLATPKNFPAIAAGVGKTVPECIQYYYLSKKTEGYKALVKKHSSTRRRRAGHSDKNGPTGPSHGTASKKTAPSKAPGSGGGGGSGGASGGSGAGGGDDHKNSPHLDSKNDDNHATSHRKGGGGGGNSTRGRANRRGGGGGGGGEHRATKGGSVRGRSGTPVPPQNNAGNSITTTVQPDSTVPDNSKQAPADSGDKRHSSTPATNTEEESNNQASNEGCSSIEPKVSNDPAPSYENSTKSEPQPPPPPPSQPHSSVSSRPTDVGAAVASAPESRGQPICFQDILKPNVDKVYAASVSSGSNSLDPRRGYGGQTGAITDSINLTHGSPVSGTFSPSPRADDLPHVRLLSYNDGGGVPPRGRTYSGMLDPLTGLNKAGGLSIPDGLSPDVLAKIPQLSAAAAALYGVPGAPSSQSVLCGENTQSPTHTQSSSDPSASAYSKAILIGDFCTAQQLSKGSASSQPPAPLLQTTANMTGTSIQRAADYTDPAYLANRAIDPSSLPVPSKRHGSVASNPPLGAGRPLGHGVMPQGHVRSPSMSHHPQSPPLPSPVGSRHRPLTSGMDMVGSRQNQSRSIYGPPQGGLTEALATATAKAGAYYDLTGLDVAKKAGGGSTMNLETLLRGGGAGGGAIDPKVDEYIKHATKLYAEEVEGYTSRDRSDSMRTRTSSETSQQMHTAIDNVRQRVHGMNAAAAAAGDGGGASGLSAAAAAVAGYNAASAFTDSPEPTMGGLGLLEIHEILSKCSPQYLSLLAATGDPEAAVAVVGAAVAASSNAAGALETRGPKPPPLVDSSGQLGPLKYVSQAPSMPLPRYRKSLTTAPASASLAAQRDFYQHHQQQQQLHPRQPLPQPGGMGEDGPHRLGGLHHNVAPPTLSSTHHRPHHSQTPQTPQQQQSQSHTRYPTLMRASASRNLESMGLLPEELAQKASSSSRPQHQQQHPPTSGISSSSLAGPPSTSAGATVPGTSAFSSSPSQALSSTLTTSAAFRFPPGDSSAAVAATVTTTSATGPTSVIGTLNDQIDKAITDGIIIQQGDQDVAKINPSTAEARSLKSVHPSSSLLKIDNETGNGDNQDLPSVLLSTTLASPVGVLAGPSPTTGGSGVPLYPTKKRSRLTSGGSVGGGGGVVAQQPGSRAGPESFTPVHTATSPASTDGGGGGGGGARSAPSKSPVTATPVAAQVVNAISPASSVDSPGNLQICLPPEDEQPQFSPKSSSGTPRPGSHSRHTPSSQKSTENQSSAPQAPTPSSP